jgi:hypothetical protein
MISCEGLRLSPSDKKRPGGVWGPPSRLATECVGIRLPGHGTDADSFDGLEMYSPRL